MADSYTHDVSKTAPRNDVTRCPDCGAQLVVNLRGDRVFTCGREDLLCASGAVETYIRCPNAAEPPYTDICAWCGTPAEDATGLGWAMCPECGELYGATTPPSVSRDNPCADCYDPEFDGGEFSCAHCTRLDDLDQEGGAR